MKFCLQHWENLKDGLKARHMDHLIAKSGQQLVDRFKREKQGQAVVPDPLMESHNMILSRTLQFLPHVLGVNEQDPEGHFCPLCEAKKYMPPHPETKLPCDEAWITTLLDYLKEEYTKEGWLKSN